MTRGFAHAKINLALVVGPLRADGAHEVVTVLQEIDLADEISVEVAHALTVAGFAEDTLVRGALEELARTAGTTPGWQVRIEKRIPVAAGLGGGSSDAATALSLVNATLAEPLPVDALHTIAARIGADVPFFLAGGSQLGTGHGTELVSLVLPLDYVVVLVRPDGATKDSTAGVYRAFDERAGADGFDERRARLLAALGRVEQPHDLAALPPNDLASSVVAEELVQLGAFRADVTGAGPVVYGLFEDAAGAERAAAALQAIGPTWLARPRSRTGAGTDEAR